MAEFKNGQYHEDLERFVFLMHKYTKIPIGNLRDALKERPVADVFSLKHLLCSSPDQLKRLEELHELKYTFDNLKAFGNDKYVIDSTVKAGRYHVNFLQDVRDKELFLLTCLDIRNRVIKTRVVSEGTINEAPVYPRELIKEILIYNAASIIVAHNHPGGSQVFSPSDRTLTTKLRETLENLNIRLLDHILVTGNAYASYEEMEVGDAAGTARHGNSTHRLVSMEESTVVALFVHRGAAAETDLELDIESERDESDISI